jgi:integrase
MGSIYRRKWKDKDGNIREGEILWIKYYRNGKPIRESTGSTKDADAKRLLKKREGEISAGKLPGIYFDRVRFDELAEDFLTDYRINRQKSLDRAELSVKHLGGMFEGMRVTSIDTPKINTYIERRLTEGAANATINRELSALKRMLNLGARQTPPKVSRVPYIPMLKENNTRKGFFDYWEFVAVRDALPDYLKGYVTFAYKVGWRKEEISGLMWSQVDRENWIAYLHPGDAKNDEARTVYLDEEVKEVFKEQWISRKKNGILTPYVFPNWDGTGKIKNFITAWKTACKKAGVGNKLFHDFRRTAVRNMVRAGIPERVAMKVSGHKTRAVFDRYNIVNDTDLKLAAQRQEAYLQTQMGTISGTVSKIQHITKKERINQ